MKASAAIVPLSYNILTTPARFCLFTSKEKRIFAGYGEIHCKSPLLSYRTNLHLSADRSKNLRGKSGATLLYKQCLPYFLA